MEWEQIYELMIATIPSATAVISVVAMVIKVASNLKTIRKDIDDKTDFKEFQHSVSKIVDENQRLKEENKKLQNQINHVQGD